MEQIILAVKRLACILVKPSSNLELWFLMFLSPSRRFLEQQTYPEIDHSGLHSYANFIVISVLNNFRNVVKQHIGRVINSRVSIEICSEKKHPSELTSQGSSATYSSLKCVWNQACSDFTYSVHIFQGLPQSRCPFVLRCGI